MQASSFYRTIPLYLTQPIRLFQEYDRHNLRADVIAGITVAVVLLPQAIAFALIADLPPEMGLYTAIAASIVGALWGSSNQVQTGPTNALSLLVLSALGFVSAEDPSQVVIAAGLMAVMIGVFQLVLGLARLGVLVNYVSHSVIVGFASGAGVLIAIKQLTPLFGFSVQADNILNTIWQVILRLSETNIPTFVIGAGTIVLMLILRAISKNIPAALVSMVVTTAAVILFNLDEQGVSVIGQLPRGFPPLARLPLFNLELLGDLSTGALAVAAIGLVQTSAIARSMAAQTGQRLDSNQEFVGQGLANIASGFFSGYAASASFSISAVNYKSGAKSRIAPIFSAVFLLIAMFILGPFAAFLPRAALAGVLIITAYGMIDYAEIRRITQAGGHDAIIMAVTFFGTLFLDIDFAVLLGIIISFAFFIMKSSAPHVSSVLPDDDFKHFIHQPDKPNCPQLGIINISGDLYFGAVSHIEEEILTHLEKNPTQRYLLIRMHGVNQIDFSGIHLLEAVHQKCHERGGDIFLVRVNKKVRELMHSTKFENKIGDDHFLDEDEALSYLFYRKLDPAICIYECPVRAFKECQNLPKRDYDFELPVLNGHEQTPVPLVEPASVWSRLQTNVNDALIVDVREPREFQQSRVPFSQSLPLSELMSQGCSLPPDEEIVLVCRSGRRSQRAAQLLQQHGYHNLSIIEGGMLAWESADLLTAIDPIIKK